MEVPRNHRAHTIVKIFTYYHDMGVACCTNMANLWKESWAAQGWEAVILGPQDAAKHPKFGILTDHAKTLPTVNDKGYEMACYQRWCAFALEGGLISDFDVLPRDTFPPREFSGFINAGVDCGVSLFHGRPSDYEIVIDTIICYSPSQEDQWEGKPHVSDATIIRKNLHIFPNEMDLVRGYTDPGWETAELIHYANLRLKHRGKMERVAEIKLIQKELADAKRVSI